ncbi:hypothetical protein KIPB_004975 [Kipferlia bialata]|uniref:AMP-activated protein kinase glycogen-binding domain-containing protein n=1 Tax=Kipferlia bialata TaxID=797122 RepID=A0A9K3GIK5_9EUKA|nr:hypothetical protein KIPB_004975 [Kipferlia bialata]|eukprot:g4975.t1
MPGPSGPSRLVHSSTYYPDLDVPALLGQQGKGGAIYTFSVSSPAREVCIRGDWDGWVSSTPLERKGDTWQVLLRLSPGTHQYKYVMDGHWTLDPCTVTCPDGHGNTNNWVHVLASVPPSAQSSPRERERKYHGR